MAELYAKTTGCCGGRGGSMHLYDPPSGLFGTNGLVGAGIPLAVGAAISAKVRGTKQVAVAFFGDGAVNHGTFHESLNFAAAQNAPAVFVCENNMYATATPLTVATKNTDVASKGASYAMPSVAVDGNDVLAMWSAMRTAAERARSGGGPTLIEARTYRTVGHHEGDPLFGTYRTKEEVERWKARDPIAMFRKRLTGELRAGSDADLDAIDAEVDREVAESVEFGRTSPEPDPGTVERHVFADPVNPPLPTPPAGGPKTVTQTWLEAVRDGLAEEMRRNPHTAYFGEGIGERGGSFAHTKGLWQEFGGGRVIDTPIAELGFTGAAIGASATGCRAVADLMFADFIFEAASQVIHQAAKLRYTSNGRMSAPVIVLAGTGEVKTAGPHHSGTYHPVWAHVPGLIVAVPSTPADAKGLIKTALRAGDPVIFLEHKSLFATKGEVPVGEDHFVPFGRARVARPGRDLTVVSAGLLLHRCLEAAELLEKQGISCDLIDLRTIVPLDVDTVVASVARTHRLLVVDEAYAMCGVGAELAAAVMEQAFDELDAPVGRLHTLAVTQPFSPVLERAAVVTVEKIVAAARAVVDGRPIVPGRAGRNTGAARGEAAAAARVEPVSPNPVPAGTPAGRPAAPAKAAGAAKPSADGVPLIMPHGDLTVTEAKVVRWLKNPGDRVKAGESVVEMETEKAVTELEAPVAGVLVEVLEAEGAVVALGQQLATIRPD
jgi:2-oxoisovalerate dehydrogenase E1 component